MATGLQAQCLARVWLPGPSQGPGVGDKGWQGRMTRVPGADVSLDRMPEGTEHSHAGSGNCGPA